MPHGYSSRGPATVGVLLLLLVAGAMAIHLLRGGSAETAGCPRPFPAAEMAATFLWTQAGDALGPAPEVTGIDPDSLRPLTDPADAETCRRLRALLPDTLHTGLLSSNLVAFYQAGDLFIAPVVPTPKRGEIEAMERGEPIEERTGTTYLFDREYRLVATYAE